MPNRAGLTSVSVQAAAPGTVPQDSAASVDEQPKEDGEDPEDLLSVLEHLGLSEYKSTFDDEKIDVESFVRRAAELRLLVLVFTRVAAAASLCRLFLQLLCTIEDLKEMGIPLGPRKKMAKFVKERVSKQVRASPGHAFVFGDVDSRPGAICPPGGSGEEGRG